MHGVDLPLTPNKTECLFPKKVNCTPTEYQCKAERTRINNFRFVFCSFGFRIILHYVEDKKRIIPMDIFNRWLFCISNFRRRIVGGRVFGNVSVLHKNIK